MTDIRQVNLPDRDLLTALRDALARATDPAMREKLNALYEQAAEVEEPTE